MEKIMWTQYTLPLGLYVFRIKFGLCSHYFFLVSIETTIDLLETENMMLIGNKKTIGTQSVLQVSLCLLLIKFGSCSYYFFLVSIETTYDWLQTENMVFSSNRK